LAGMSSMLALILFLRFLDDPDSEELEALPKSIIERATIPQAIQKSMVGRSKRYGMIQFHSHITMWPNRLKSPAATDVSVSPPGCGCFCFLHTHHFQQRVGTVFRATELKQ
jgi:hypothetical protein